ncbi:MAG TPA: hypothetical protein VHB50_04790 [Bryobacteraceae bacterium]|nr:hypothetical protein [Bryobacteraceae bacterium]
MKSTSGISGYNVGVIRNYAALFCAASLASTAVWADVGTRDRYFTRYPFDTWQKDGEHSQIHWYTRVLPAHLSDHQRLTARIQIEIDAKEVAKRRGRGQLVTLLQIEDESGQQWRQHNSFSLSTIPPGVKPHSLLYSQDVFVLPGDYTISLAACDSRSSDYSFRRKSLHVAPLHGDPLPEAWRDLPAVEFVVPFGAPDFWFQPYVRGRLRLPIQSSRPVHVDVMMNMTPSERQAGSMGVFRRNMSILVPALKLLSALDIAAGSLDVTLLDLARRKSWEQKDARGLDWVTMRAPFADNKPGVIDAQSLAAKGEMAQFFRDQVAERLHSRGGEESRRVVIVLSAPVFLEHQYKVSPPDFPRDPDSKIFYLRYRPTAPMRPVFTAFDQGPRPPAMSIPNDDLEHALKAMEPHVFSAGTPGDFRKAVSSMLAEIARM